MKTLPKLALLAAFALCAFAAPRQGITPREKPGDYSVSRQRGDLALGAMKLSKEQVRNSFASDLDKGYIVVEVGVFPGANAVDVKHDDFALRVAGSKTLIRPATPETIAAVLQKKNRNSSDHTIDIYPTTSVGYSTGGRDPYGNRYPGGVSTSAGVGVGIGGSAPSGATDADRKVMKTELQDKLLPEGSATNPVAGYLYFPVATKEKVTYELEYRAGDQKLVLALSK